MKTQTVYIPVDVNQELPPYQAAPYFVEGVPQTPSIGSGLVKSTARRVDTKGVAIPQSSLKAIQSNNEFSSHLYVTHWLKEQELICFTPEELQLYRKEVIKEWLEGIDKALENNEKGITWGENGAILII